MLTLIAEPMTSDPSFGWGSLAGPIGVVFGALIGAFVAWRNGRKSVYDRLETLVKIRNEWPPESTEGMSTIDHSIELALAEIRAKEPGHALGTPTEPERQANREVQTRLRWEAAFDVATTLGIGASFIAAAGFIDDSRLNWFLGLLIGLMVLTVIARGQMKR